MSTSAFRSFLREAEQFEKSDSPIDTYANSSTSINVNRTQALQQHLTLMHMDSHSIKVHSTMSLQAPFLPIPDPTQKKLKLNRDTASRTRDIECSSSSSKLQGHMQALPVLLSEYDLVPNVKQQHKFTSNANADVNMIPETDLALEAPVPAKSKVGFAVAAEPSHYSPNTLQQGIGNSKSSTSRRMSFEYEAPASDIIQQKHSYLDDMDMDDLLKVLSLAIVTQSLVAIT